MKDHPVFTLVNADVKNTQGVKILITGGLGYKRVSGDHLKHNIKVGQDIKESPRDLKKLAFTQTLVINHPLTLVSKKLS